uniref:Uncharacterized protein n=1 Tax=Triticum urartu TaxID=4572 RepID=A0A8R7PVF4_TRIUA
RSCTSLSAPPPRAAPILPKGLEAPASTRRGQCERGVAGASSSSTASPPAGPVNPVLAFHEGGMGCNSETSVAGEGTGSGDLRRRRAGRDGAGASSSSSSFAEGTREFVLSSMDERFSGSVDADGFPSSRREG